jgi:hypothetical protein
MLRLRAIILLIGVIGLVYMVLLLNPVALGIEGRTMAKDTVEQQIAAIWDELATMAVFIQGLLFLVILGAVERFRSLIREWRASRSRGT